jgi:thiamine biosynthesis lipoprotein
VPPMMDCSDGLWPAQDWRVFGTGARLVVTDPRALAAARRAVDTELEAIDLAASRFRPDSELSRLNAAQGRAVSVSDLFAELVKVGLEAASETEGLVDPTLGAQLEEIGYDRTFREIPTDGPAPRFTVRRQANWPMVELDVLRGTVRLPVGVLLDLGATAKAHAADRAADAAHRACGAGVLVSLGGDIGVSGSPPDDGWPVAITDDSNAFPETTGPVVVITAGGLATSSTTVRQWQREGIAMHHLLDPSSGQPVSGPWRTISVASTSCLAANTAATAAMVVGEDAAAWLTGRGVPARLVAHDGAIRVLSGWPEEPE